MLDDHLSSLYMPNANTYAPTTIEIKHNFANYYKTPYSELSNPAKVLIAELVKLKNQIVYHYEEYDPLDDWECDNYHFQWTLYIGYYDEHEQLHFKKYFRETRNPRVIFDDIRFNEVFFDSDFDYLRKMLLFEF